MIEIILSLSLLCIDGVCEPALVGSRTPVGEFTLALMEADDATYGGSVLAFAQDASGVYAVHRPPNRARRSMLDLDARPVVTAGCVNVRDALYERLAQCCDGARVVIRRR